MKDWTDISDAIVYGLYQYPPGRKLMKCNEHCRTRIKGGVNNQHKTDDWATHKMKMKNKRRKNNKNKSKT